jgi:light-regulated signal transduction histidine kinase (bacteriophytochrome)
MSTFTQVSGLDRESLLHRIVNRIRQSLELQEVLNETVAEVRSFLGTDRVKVYRFFPDGSGEVIAEAIQDDRLPSLLGLNFPADDIPLHAREMFVRARQRRIVDVVMQQIGISFPQEVARTETQDEIFYRSVDPCHVAYLTAMGVKSSVVVPLLHQEQLWGLLVSHHSQPRTVTAQELEFLQMVADQVSVAIAQSTLLLQTRKQAKREATVNRISSLLHGQAEIQFEEALQETITALSGSGGRLYLLSKDTTQPGTVCPAGEQPLCLGENMPLEHSSVWQRFFASTAISQQVWTITDLYQESALRSISACFRPTSIRGMLVVSLLYGQQCLGYLTLFRNEVNTETLWAGQVDPDQRQLQPRNSFAAWKESKKGQAPTWTGEDIELALSLGKQFVMAVRQHQLYQQVRALNDNLEQQVEERTIALQLATEQQKALAQVIGKIRATLDLDLIFNTATQETRYLLNSDRVAVFQFFAESAFEHGRFIAEAVLEDFPSVLQQKLHDHCFGEQYAIHYQNGRIHTVVDIHDAGLKDCHIEALSHFGIQANLAVPILQGEELWGLLCVHQCQEPRQWQPSEIEFVRQVATQLGVALQQAELLAQTKQQAEQLRQAFHELQQAQTHLIQTEKMSSLGQLVAGVAHEINNPVNFIYGNLNHASEYTLELLDVLQLYQQHYPDPVAEIRDRSNSIDLEFLSEDLPRILASMKTGADRIRQIVLSLRNFSRFDQAEMKEVDIHEGIDSTLMILQHRLKAKPEHAGIEVIKEYGELPQVECYAGQLNQVFMNVLSNAIDALEEIASQRTTPGEIRIRTCLKQNSSNLNHVVVQIADNGPGISEESRARIFDPFFTTKPIGRGTGLGLSISYQIVAERHGGVFNCTSRPGEGTEFWIEIPLQQTPAPLVSAGIAD